MHLSSYRHVEDLAQRYLSAGASLVIADLGSQDVNGSYRPIFEQEMWRYVGLDLQAGANVDVVLPSSSRIPVRSGTYDVLVSGQAIEHMEHFWLTWLEVTRVVKPGGLIFLVAPSRGPEHRYPVDCWRFYPDGMRALARWGRVDLIEVTTDWHPDADADSALWGDTVAVFRVPNASAARWDAPLRRLAMRYLAA